MLRGVGERGKMSEWCLMSVYVHIGVYGCICERVVGMSKMMLYMSVPSGLA